ncbi:hypothetical protein BRADI_1g70185v3 [Brachypodium distachyon]|uniref:Uncharacterized protein n=1 Tax=Brachypodium distachyon TaxID=15368 RepID=A0A2K2DUE5_BRADI|nr:hypothetical protein BRADI_1g70185v3 [Brachypodium distachyon]
MYILNVCENSVLFDLPMSLFKHSGRMHGSLCITASNRCLSQKKNIVPVFYEHTNLCSALFFTDLYLDLDSVR